MLDSDWRAAGQKDYGAQEAAHLLGIHRSTLHHAVKRGLIVPDFQTPGKHYRFRTSTLEAFGEYLKTEAATSETRLVAPVQILGNLAHTLALSDGFDKACQEAVDLLCESHLGIDMACVALHDDDAPNDHGLCLIAHRGFPPWLFQDYANLRPTMRLAVQRVLRTMEPIECADTMGWDVEDNRPTRLARRANMRSYVVLPIPSTNERTQQAYGVLVVASKTARHYTEMDNVLLKGVTDQLAVALVGAAMPASPDKRVNRRMMQRAFATLANDKGVATRENCQRLQDIFLEETGAEEVFTLGFGDADIIKRDIQLDGRLHDLGCRACANDELVSEGWQEAGARPFTAAAASVLLRPRHRAAIGAVWGGVRRCGEPEHALLVSFASAYALAAHVDIG